MGNETILYYVTQETITGECGELSAVPDRKHFWQRQELPYFMVEQDNLTIYAVLIPMQPKHWYKQGKNHLKAKSDTKGQSAWKPEKLLRLMQDAQERVIQYEQERIRQSETGMGADDFTQKRIVLQPDIETILHLEKEEIPDIFLFLSGKILSLRKKDFDSVVLLLGSDMFVELQMRLFAEMMQPFFSRINHLTILYEADEEEQDRWQEAIEEYTDAFYYEYGLMTQIFGTKDRDSRSRNKRYGRENTRQTGENTLFIDYGYAEELPLRMMQAGDTYLDIASSGKKETLLKRKYAEVSYLSPRKYLDTVVKSGYDKLVHLCK